MVGQLLIDLTRLTPARIMVLFVTSGVALGALGVYGPLAEFAGCGATVPLTLDRVLLSEGVRKAVEEEGFFRGVHRRIHRRGSRDDCSHLLWDPGSTGAKPRDKS